MRAGRFGRWAGRTAIVVALGAVALIAGASAAGAAELTGGSAGAVVGQVAQSTASDAVRALDAEWQ